MPLGLNELGIWPLCGKQSIGVLDMLKRLVVLVLLTFALGPTLAACDAPEVEEAEEAGDD